MSKIKLYQFETSPFCHKVRCMMNYKNIDYEIIEVSLRNFGKGMIKKMSSTNKLPIIEHNGNIIADSTNIAFYLEEHFPKPNLFTNDKKLNALIHIIED